MSDRTSITITADTWKARGDAVLAEAVAMKDRGFTAVDWQFCERDGKFCADLEFVEDGK